jgi:hypothetical protein
MSPSGGDRVVDNTAAFLERANRGNEAEVSESAKLSADSARAWLKRRGQAQAENDQRRVHREVCLRDSALAGGAAGTVGAALAWRLMNSSAALPNSSGPSMRWYSLLGIKVSGKAIGGGGQAFVLFCGFFMPFTFIANVTRWRCMKSAAGAAGVENRKPPSSP